MTLSVLSTAGKIRLRMRGETELLLPISEPRLREEDRDDGSLKADDADGASPRKDEGPSETPPGPCIGDRRAESAQDREANGADKLFDFLHGAL